MILRFGLFLPTRVRINIFSESIKLIVCDKEDDGEDQEDYLCTGDIDLVPLSKNKNISRVVSMVDSEGNDAGNLFVQLKWKYPYKKRSKPIEAQKPIVASELIAPPDEEILVPKKKKSARKSLENYLHERNSDAGSVKSLSQTSMKSAAKNDIPEEPIYVTPPKSPEVPSESKSEVPEEPVEVTADLDDTLPADKTLPPEPEIESENNDENEAAEEPSAVEEEIIDEEIIDEEVEDVIESQSVHSAATEASGIQFKEDKPISDTVSTPRGSVASMKSIQKSYSPVIIQIKRLEIVENGPVRDNNVFIEFDFCGEVEETNESLPFPTEDNPSHFDFRKEFNFKVSFIQGHPRAEN